MGSRKTNEEFVVEVYNLVGEEYTFLDEYINSRTKIRVRHNTCGRVYYKDPKYFLKGQRCKACVSKDVGKKQRKRPEDFVNEVHTLFGKEFEVISKYVNTSNKIEVKHKCGNTYSVRPDALLRGSGCPKCVHNMYSKTYMKTTEEYSKEVVNTTSGEYELSSEYRGVKDRVKIKHTECGTTYDTTPHQFNRGRRCPKCNMSKGEVAVKQALEELNVVYEPQKTFKELGTLSYDFYLPDYKLLVEYQGVQHYKPIELFGGDNQFQVQKRNDKRKKDFAEEGSYTLLEIPYTVSNYEDILKCVKEKLISVKQRTL